jgi:hypothetical protein
MSIDRETIVNESILRRFRASDTAVLISMGLFDFLAHIALAGRYGFFRDELYNMIRPSPRSWPGSRRDCSARP